jgi:geranylgeranyl diphosphate synthase, type I
VAAVLAGDYAAALALETLAGISLPKASLEAAIARFSRMQHDAVLGQQLDSFATDGDPETVYALKTGSYTVAGPLALGATIAGAKSETLRALERFALPIGIAFQLRDDLLGAFGEPSETGKPLGSDLRAGKRTRLLLEARRLLKARERSALERVVGNDKARELDVRRALSSIESSGARAKVEAQILELAATARAALSRGVSADGVALLSGAIDALTERVS